MADTAVPPDLPVALPAELETIASPEAREAAIQRTVGVLEIALAELHDAFDWSAVEEAMAQPRTGSAGNPVDTQPKPTGRSRSVLVPDNLTQDGAEVVAEQLDAYWHSLARLRVVETLDRAGPRGAVRHMGRAQQPARRIATSSSAHTAAISEAKARQ